MKFKRIMLISVLLAILAIGTVTASDNIAQENLTVNDDLIIESSVNDEFLSTNGSSGTFSDLSGLIDGASEGSILKLDKDYQNDGSTPEDGIAISKGITIDGNGHILNANGKSRIFNVQVSGITIKNIVFKNGYHSSGDGGAISSDGENLTVRNCSFTNCRAEYNAGAVNGDGSVIDSRFVNCSAAFNGGAVYGCDAFNCSFRDCSIKSSGGAISFYYDDKYHHVTDSTFINCRATNKFKVSGGAMMTSQGGAICMSLKGAISNCIFENCSSVVSGGAIFWAEGEGKIEGSTFINTNAEKGKAIYMENKKVVVTNSNFKGDAASLSDLIEGGTVSNCVLEQIKNPEVIISVNANEKDIYTFVLPNDAKGSVEVFVNGTIAIVVDIVNGIAKVDLSQYRDGNYDLTFKYSGDDKYDSFSGVIVLTDYNLNPIVSAKNLKAIYASGKSYSATLTDKEGNRISGVEVVFKINGKEISKTKTNIKGVASFKINNVPGTYKVTAAAGKISVKRTLTVNHLVSLKSAKVKKSAKKLVLQATLAKVNGKKYTAKTNKKGIAKLTIKSSVLKKLKVGKKVTYQATYLKDTVKKTAKIKK